MKKNTDNSKIQKKEEESTPYGEFIASCFAWIPLPRQKERVDILENINKKHEK